MNNLFLIEKTSRQDSLAIAVTEEGIGIRQIAEAIGVGLKMAVLSLSADEAKGDFGALALVAGMDMAASSLETRRQLNWVLTGPGRIYELEQSFLAQHQSASRMGNA